MIAASMAFVHTDADLRSLVTGARDIIYACDAGGHFTYANPFALELMGYAEHEILGRHFLTLVREDHRDEARKFYGRQLVDGLGSFEARRRVRDGWPRAEHGPGVGAAGRGRRCATEVAGRLRRGSCRARGRRVSLGTRAHHPVSWSRRVT